MHKERVKAHAGPIVPILVMFFLALLGASVMMGLPDEMGYRWIVEGLTFILILYLFYLDIRYFIAEHVYRLNAHELTVTREKLGFLRDVSLTVDLRDAILLAKKGDPRLREYSNSPADNFCASIGGWLKTGSVLVYNDREDNNRIRRLLFQPSQTLTDFVSDQVKKTREENAG